MPDPHQAPGQSKVVVCGSRNWPAPWFVTAKLIELVPRDWLVITGGAKNRLRDDRGRPLSVDQHAHLEAVRLGHPTKVMRADWNRYGKRAGFIRNVEMLEEEPLKVLAFHHRQSSGTAHTIRVARERGIEVHAFTERDLRPDVVTLDMGDVA